MFSEIDFPEKLATLVHRYSEALAPDFGLPSRSPEWSELRIEERHRLTAAIRLALLDLRNTPAPDSREIATHHSPEFGLGGSEGKECGS